jgi:DNA-directed RNA polymerase specialized sigma24 family protein
MTQDSPEPRRHPSESMLSTRWTQIGALQGKDANQAWQWFVARYRPFVRGILLGMLGRAELAEPAADEFWGYVWMSGALQRADRDRRFRAFLSGIVRNFARSWSRDRKVNLAADAALDGLRAPDDHTELEHWVGNVVVNAVTLLRAENPKTADALCRFYGLTDSGGPDGSRGPMAAGEVARAVGNTAQGVYMLLFRGRKRMRELIEAELREGCRDDEAYRSELQTLLGVTSSKLPGLLGDGS